MQWTRGLFKDSRIGAVGVTGIAVGWQGVVCQALGVVDVLQKLGSLLQGTCTGNEPEEVWSWEKEPVLVCFGSRRCQMERCYGAARDSDPSPAHQRGFPPSAQQEVGPGDGHAGVSSAANPQRVREALGR